MPVNEAALVSLGKQKKKNAVEKIRPTLDPETNEGAPVLSGKKKKKSARKKTRWNSHPETNMPVNEPACDLLRKQ